MSVPISTRAQSRCAVFASVLGASCLGVACSESNGATLGPAAEDGGRWTAPVAVRAADPFPREFVNLAGERSAIAQPPQRIASGTLFTDAVLLAICPKDRIAALHEVSLKPLFSPVATESAAFPRHLTPDPESFLAVRPDLVFLASFSDQRMARLVSADGRPVIRLHRFSSIAGVQDSIRAVGYITGLDHAAERLVGEMQQRLDAVRAGGEARRPWRILSFADGFVAGRDTIFDDVVRYVGATNLAAESGLTGARQISIERVLAMKPDALVIGVLPGTEEAARQKLRRLHGMSMLTAVQRDRIVFVPNNQLLSTTHHLAGAAEAIARALDRWGKP